MAAEPEFVLQFEDENTEIDCKNGTKITAFVCLLPGYHKSVSPKRSGEPSVQINSSINLKRIREVNVIDRYITFDITLDLFWVDNRVAKIFTKESVEIYENTGTIVLPIESLNEVWSPDLYIFDMKQFEAYKVINSINSLSILYNYHWFPTKYSMEYTRNNTVLEYYLDARVKVYCFDFDFSNFPFEENNCTFLFGTANHKVDFVFGEGDDWKGTTALGKFVNGYRITEIAWINNTAPIDVHSDWYGGMGKAVGFTIYMKRKITPFLIQYYIPSAAIVMLTQISFIVPISSIPGRVALLVTEFLTLTNLFIHQQSESPSTGGERTALSIYLMASMFIIAAAVLEFAVVLIMKHHPRNTKLHPRKNITVGSSDDGNSGLEADWKIKYQFVEKKEACVLNDNEKKQALHEKIDYACFLIFPIGFVLFNSLYFSVYTIM